MTVNAVVTTTVRLQFDSHSTAVRLRYDRSTTILLPTPSCVWAAALRPR